MALHSSQPGNTSQKTERSVQCAVPLCKGSKFPQVRGACNGSEFRFANRRPCQAITRSFDIICRNLNDLDFETRPILKYRIRFSIARSGFQNGNPIRIGYVLNLAGSLHLKKVIRAIVQMSITHSRLDTLTRCGHCCLGNALATKIKFKLGFWDSAVREAAYWIRTGKDCQSSRAWRSWQPVSHQTGFSGGPPKRTED